MLERFENWNPETMQIFTVLRAGKINTCARFRKVPLNLEDEIDIRGKIVVITGSNSGIGKVAALEMAKRGAFVVMACRDIPKAEKVVQEIKNKFPEAVLVISCQLLTH